MLPSKYHVRSDRRGTISTAPSSRLDGCPERVKYKLQLRLVRLIIVVSEVVLGSTALPQHLLEGPQCRPPRAEPQHIAPCGCTKSTERFCASRCPALGSPSSKDLMLGRAHTPPSGQPRGRMISQLAEALEPEVPVAAQRQQRDSSSSTGPLGHQNFDNFNLLSQIWNAPDHS